VEPNRAKATNSNGITDDGRIFLVTGPVSGLTIFTIFEGMSEIQRMIIGRLVTGLDVR
jgi:hypothetical protein